MSGVILVTGGSGLVGNGIKSISDKYPDYDFVFISSNKVLKNKKFLKKRNFLLKFTLNSFVLIIISLIRTQHKC